MIPLFLPTSCLTSCYQEEDTDKILSSAARKSSSSNLLDDEETEFSENRLHFTMRHLNISVKVLVNYTPDDFLCSKVRWIFPQNKHFRKSQFSHRCQTPVFIRMMQLQPPTCVHTQICTQPPRSENNVYQHFTVCSCEILVVLFPGCCSIDLFVS